MLSLPKTGAAKKNSGCYLLKLVAYHLVHMDKPYINLHLLHLSSVQHQIPRDAQGAGC